MQTDNSYYADLKEALERLEKNDDFKKVILDDYCKNKVLNLTSLIGNETIKTNGHRADVMEELIAISKLQNYFLMVKNIGSSFLEAKKEFEDKERIGNE